MKLAARSALICYCALAAMACGDVQNQQPVTRPRPALPGSAVEGLGSDNFFIVAETETQLVNAGPRALPLLARTAMKPLPSPYDAGRLQRNAIRVMVLIAKAHPSTRREVTRQLVDVAVATQPMVAGIASERLKKMNRGDVLSDLLDVATGPDAGRAAAARAVLFGHDGREVVDRTIGLLTGAERAPWYPGPSGMERGNRGKLTPKQTAALQREEGLILLLRKLTGQNFGYLESTDPYTKAEAVAQWAKWWQAHHETFGRKFEYDDIKKLLKGFEKK